MLISLIFRRPEAEFDDGGNGRMECKEWAKISDGIYGKKMEGGDPYGGKMENNEMETHGQGF